MELGSQKSIVFVGRKNNSYRGTVIGLLRARYRMNHVCQLLLRIVSYSYTKTVVFIGVHLFTEVNICAVSQPYGPSLTEQSF